jgi:hypothetical protein
MEHEWRGRDVREDELELLEAAIVEFERYRAHLDAAKATSCGCGGTVRCAAAVELRAEALAHTTHTLELQAARGSAIAREVLEVTAPARTKG